MVERWCGMCIPLNIPDLAQPRCTELCLLNWWGLYRFSLSSQEYSLFMFSGFPSLILINGLSWLSPFFSFFYTDNKNPFSQYKVFLTIKDPNFLISIIDFLYRLCTILQYKHMVLCDNLSVIKFVGNIILMILIYISSMSCFLIFNTFCFDWFSIHQWTWK